MKNYLMFLLAFILLVPYAQAYSFDVYSTQLAHSMYVNGNCNVNINSYLTNTAGLQTISTTWNSPYSTVIGTESYTYNNQTCQFNGNFSASGSNLFTGNVAYSGTATGSVYNNYVCNASSGNIIEIGNWKVPGDSSGYKPNTYYAAGPDHHCQKTQATNFFTNCNATTFAANVSYYSAGIDGGRIFYFPFTATSSNMNSSITVAWDNTVGLGGSDWEVANIFLYNKAGDELYALGNTSNNFTSNKSFTNLVAGTDYVIAVTTCGLHATGYTNWYTPNISLFIDDRSANWDCGAWSNCTNNVEQRYCTDLNGFFAPKYEQRYCSFGILYNATLGFENYTSVADISVCSPDAACSFKVSNISVDRPTGWTINDPATYKEYFLRMSDDWATEGTRSLQMWYIPPKPYDVANGSVNGCSNITTGKGALVNRSFSNDTMSVDYNITFPYTNMGIFFDVKKCADNVQQFDATSNAACGFFNFFGISNVTKLCYGSCSGHPGGKYIFSLYDTLTGLNVFGNDMHLETSSTNYDTMFFDLSNLGLIAGRTYNLKLAVGGQTALETTPYCVYFDNIRYSTLSNTVACTSSCTGADYYKATYTTSNGTSYCQYKIEKLSDKCFNADNAATINKCKNTNVCDDYCDGSTSYQYDDSTHQYVAYENSASCEATSTETQTTAATTEQLTEGLDFFMSPLMIAILVSLGACILTIVMSGHWEIGALVFIVFLMAFSIFGWFPIWFLIIIIVLAAYIAATWAVKTVQGG